MNTGSKTIVLVVGMHRSGTSALTGLLHHFGIDVPLAPGTLIAPDNPRGHWEHTAVNRINDDILRAAGLTWTAWLPVDPGAVSANHRKRLAGLVGAEIDRSNSGFVAFKDPRICVLMPTWREVLAGQGHRLCAIYCVRHPLAVARSIEKRNGLCLERGLLLWLHYNLEALQALPGIPFMSLVFPQWMQDIEGLHRALRNMTDHPLPKSWEQCREEAEGFITPDLVHQSADETAPDYLLDRCMALYRLLNTAGMALRDGLLDEIAVLRRELDPWLRISAGVVLDERRIWRDRINDMHALINRNM